MKKCRRHAGNCELVRWFILNRLLVSSAWARMVATFVYRAVSSGLFQMWIGVFFDSKPCMLSHHSVCWVWSVGKYDIKGASNGHSLNPTQYWWCENKQSCLSRRLRQPQRERRTMPLLYMVIGPNMWTYDSVLIWWEKLTKFEYTHPQQDLNVGRDIIYLSVGWTMFSGCSLSAEVYIYCVTVYCTFAH